MKSINKILTTLFVLCLSIGFIACSEEEAEYTPNRDILTKDKTAYFPISSLKENIDLDLIADTIRIELSRIDAKEAQSISIITNDTSGFFKVPKAIEFEKGEMTKTVKIPYENIQMGVTYSIDIAIDDTYAFRYTQGVVNYTLRAGVNWIPLSGKALYTEDYLAGLYGFDPVTYEVEIHENVGIPGLYRLVDPYGEVFPEHDPEGWTPGIYYMQINASDPEGVYIPKQATGLNWGNGIFSVYSQACYSFLDKGKTLEEAKAKGVCGTLKDGVITFPKNMLIASLGTGLYNGNINGAFKLVLPTK